MAGLELSYNDKRVPNFFIKKEREKGTEEDRKRKERQVEEGGREGGGKEERKEEEEEGNGHPHHARIWLTYTMFWSIFQSSGKTLKKRISSNIVHSFLAKFFSLFDFKSFLLV